MYKRQENGHDLNIVIKAGEVGHPLLSTNQLNKMGYSTILGGDAPHLYHRRSGACVPIHEEVDQLPYLIMNVRVWEPSIKTMDDRPAVRHKQGGTEGRQSGRDLQQSFHRPAQW